MPDFAKLKARLTEARRRIKSLNVKEYQHIRNGGRYLILGAVIADNGYPQVMFTPKDEPMLFLTVPWRIFFDDYVPISGLRPEEE